MTNGWSGGIIVNVKFEKGDFIVDFKMTAPENEGFDSNRLEQIRLTAEGRIERGLLPCAASLVSRHGNIVWYERQGFSDEKRQRPLDKRALFRLASMTKPITAAAVMIQMERGRLGLFDPVSKYISGADEMTVIGTGARALNTIRVIDLLSHSSGWGSGVSGEHFFAFGPKTGETLSEVVPRYVGLGLEFEPGTNEAYSALVGFDVLAYLVECTSGMPYPEFLKRNLFEPLGMVDTTFTPTKEQQERIVTIFENTETGIRPVDMRGSIFSVLPTSYTSGGAGLLGTLEDYHCFTQMLLGGGTYNGCRILSPNSVAMMHQPILEERFSNMGRGVTWGMGMRVITSSASAALPLRKGAYGWSGAYGTHFWIDPELELTAIYFSNLTTSGGAGAETAREFENDVMQAIMEL